jgi:hypothetical protein
MTCADTHCIHLSMSMLCPVTHSVTKRVLRSAQLSPNLGQLPDSDHPVRRSRASGRVAVDDLFDLATVDLEVPRYRSLAATFSVPVSDHVVQRRCRWFREWSGMVRRWFGMVRDGVMRLGRGCSVMCPDEQHEEFEAANRDCWTLPSPFIVVCRRVRLLGVSPGHGGFGVVRY